MEKTNVAAGDTNVCLGPSTLIPAAVVWCRTVACFDAAGVLGVGHFRTPNPEIVQIDHTLGAFVGISSAVQAAHGEVACWHVDKCDALNLAGDDSCCLD